MQMALQFNQPYQTFAFLGIQIQIISSMIMTGIAYGSQKVDSCVFSMNQNMLWNHGLKTAKYTRLMTGVPYMNWMTLLAHMSCLVTCLCIQVNALLPTQPLIKPYKIILVSNTVLREVVQDQVSFQNTHSLLEFWQF